MTLTSTLSSLNKELKWFLTTLCIVLLYLTIILIMSDYISYKQHIFTLFSIYGSTLLYPIFILNALWKPLKQGWQNRLSHIIVCKAVPLIFLISIIYNAITYGLNPFHFNFLNYNWTFYSFITWTFCFVTILLILAKKNIPPIEALIFTSFNLLLMKELWEIPTWSAYTVSIQQSATSFFTSPRIFTPLIIIPLILWEHRWKPNMPFILTSILCVLTFMFFWQLPTWTLRIPFAVLSITLALNIKKKEIKK